MATQLHQILAVESDLKNRAQSELARARGLFGTDAVQGHTKRYKPLDEEGEPLPDDDKLVQATVAEVLASIQGTYGQWLNVVMTKEVTNLKTMADVVVDGVKLMSLPAPALLNLEQRLLEIRVIVDALPTNDTGVEWAWDNNQALWVSKPETTYRTRKVTKSQILVEATDKHPAQVHLYQDDVREGTWTKVRLSGAISPITKRQYLDRIDKLSRAVKQARQQANNAEIDQQNVADALFGYILGE